MGWIFNWRLWVALFVAFMLYQHPHQSAGLVHKGTGALGHAGNSLSAFVSNL